jgi:hypothetical protein
MSFQVTANFFYFTYCNPANFTSEEVGFLTISLQICVKQGFFLN